jgi:RNA polymerase sigma factor (sigma-70 family)
VKRPVQQGKDELFDGLVPYAIKLGGMLARLRRLEHVAEDAACVALRALVQARAAYDPEKGKLRPYAAEWIRREVGAYLDDQAAQVQRERPLDPRGWDEEDAAAEVHPSLVMEELVDDATEVLVDLYVAEDLRSHGEAALLTKEAREALHREVAALAEDDRRLVEMHWFEEKTWAEVGAALGVADRTARERDQRIRALLRERLILWDRVRPIRRKP